ncbi:MAG: O-antigen ligase family protein [Chlamydiae bacterium]|nr:O-antigen ligase family protein [Chlamydiota bacterium]MBI3267208.1 O-antigen ligase family protein [Chlamydiota bacterium]
MITWTTKILDCSLLTLPVAITFSRALVEILLVVIIFTWIFRALLERKTLCVEIPFLLPLFFFFISGVLALVHAPFLFKSFKELLNILEYLFLAMIARDQFRSEKKILLLTKIIVYTSLVIGIDGIVQHCFGHDLIHGRVLQPFQEAFRLTASFSHPNGLGAYLAMSFPILLSLIYQERRWIYFPIIPILLMVLALTYSRGAWVSLFFSLILFAWFKNRKMIVAMILLILLSWFILPSSITHRMQDTFNFSNATIQTRLQTWKGAWDLFLKHPVTGNGLKSFSLLLQKGYVHNCYLQILVEMGALGLLSFLWILGYFFRGLFSCQRKTFNIGYGCSILAFTIHSLSDTHLYSIPIATFFWLILGIGISLSSTLSSTEYLDSSINSKPSKTL